MHRKRKKIPFDFWISSKARAKLPLFPFRVRRGDQTPGSRRRDASRSNTTCAHARENWISSIHVCSAIFGYIANAIIQGDAPRIELVHY